MKPSPSSVSIVKARLYLFTQFLLEASAVFEALTLNLFESIYIRNIALAIAFNVHPTFSHIYVMTNLSNVKSNHGTKRNLLAISMFSP